MNLLLLICIIPFYVICHDVEIVNVDFGLMKGKKFVIDNKNVTAFYGVPYSRLVIGRRKFFPPIYLFDKYWDEEVYDATFRRNGCYQDSRPLPFPYFEWLYPHSMAEHCLHLNIWKPPSPNGGVLVFIFSHDLLRGSAYIGIHNGAYLAVKTGLIVVNINFRLGFHGFSYLGENGKYIKGNMGLLDQQYALKWIYENIEKFGGNKNTITLFGHGMGGALASAHLYSEESSRYFSNMYISSGSIRNVWAFQSRSVVEETTKKVAYRVNCTGDDEQLFECLKKASPYKIETATTEVLKSGNLPFKYGINIIETDELFFNGSLIEKIRKNQMKQRFNLIIGKSMNEGSFHLSSFIDGFEFGCGNVNSNSKLDDNTCKMSKHQFEIFLRSINKHLKLEQYQLEVITKRFVSTSKKNVDYRSAATKIISDLFFNYELEKFALDMSTNDIAKKVYFYEFSRISTADRKSWPEWMLPLYGSELQYIFGLPFRLPSIYSKRFIKIEQSVSLRMMAMVNNFVLKGTPGKQFTEFTSKEQKVYIVGDNDFCRDKPRKISNVFPSSLRCIYDYLPKNITI
ncbi:Acetylcholinesterase [Strongyloides ratti]|uniref:Acetylcholinesterase n=1 Tax=Strongyloides ratti TaxID=34506 RepID=A0A090MRL1_STRRB|nr:Acetylcholinesterase [Strongyloides ratti]CEF60868.1 Acetylcholinesterase [Strongyloides ratti]